MSASYSGENSIRDVIMNKKKDVVSRHVHSAGCQELQDKAREKKYCA